ncbi:MAG: hypothetical protein JNJ47_01130 [Alphaproteobacteria bacterium]|nr:hypothetical protein [Alphaproteobacteria bacterium]
MAEKEVLSIAEKGTNNSNLYVNIASQGTGRLAGNNVDPKLGKADRLLAFKESMVRQVNSVAENTFFAAGEIDASWVYIEILRTQAAIYSQNAFIQGNLITPINIYRVDIINGKYTVTEEISYGNCSITKFESQSISQEGQKLDTLKLWFRFTSRTDTLYLYDQTGQPQGQDVSTINFINGTLQAAPAS